MNFRFIRVIHFPGRGWHIQWSFSRTNANNITIERAEGEEGPWVEVATLGPSTVFYTDCIDNRSFFGKMFYRIKTSEVTSKPVSTENESNALMNEMVRQHNLLLYGVNGAPGQLANKFACFKKQESGHKYQESRGYNGEVVLGKSYSDESTGYHEGYANPIIFNGRWISSIQKQRITSVTGSEEHFQRQLWTSNYPIFEPGDVLIERGNGEAYEVKSVDVRAPAGIVISQTVLCSQISKSAYEARELFYPGDEPR